MGEESGRVRQDQRSSLIMARPLSARLSQDTLGAYVKRGYAPRVMFQIVKEFCVRFISPMMVFVCTIISIIGQKGD